MYERISRSERIRAYLEKLMEDECSSEITKNLYNSEIAWIRKNFPSVEVTVINDCGKLKACKIKKSSNTAES